MMHSVLPILQVGETVLIRFRRKVKVFTADKQFVEEGVKWELLSLPMWHGGVMTTSTCKKSIGH